MMMYNAANWFWIVDGDQSRVYSSAACGFMPISDSRYATFLQQGGYATAIPSLDELAAVLWTQFPAGMLPTYANTVQWAKAIGGYQTTIQGQQILFPTTPDSMAFIGGKVQRLQQPNPPTSIIWQISANVFVDIPSDDFTSLAVAIADAFQATFDTLATVMSQIAAGTITTREQIDAAFAS